VLNSNLASKPKNDAKIRAVILTYSDKIIISHKSLSKEKIKIKDFVKISIMFI